jgi:hypothetical protein
MSFDELMAKPDKPDKPMDPEVRIARALAAKAAIEQALSRRLDRAEQEVRMGMKEGDTLVTSDGKRFSLRRTWILEEAT